MTSQASTQAETCSKQIQQQPTSSKIRVGERQDSALTSIFTNKSEPMSSKTNNKSTKAARLAVMDGIRPAKRGHDDEEASNDSSFMTAPTGNDSTIKTTQSNDNQIEAEGTTTDSFISLKKQQLARAASLTPVRPSRSTASAANRMVKPTPPLNRNAATMKRKQSPSRGATKSQQDKSQQHLARKPKRVRQEPNFFNSPKPILKRREKGPKSISNQIMSQGVVVVESSPCRKRRRQSNTTFNEEESGRLTPTITNRRSKNTNLESSSQKGESARKYPKRTTMPTKMYKPESPEIETELYTEDSKKKLTKSKSPARKGPRRVKTPVKGYLNPRINGLLLPPDDDSEDERHKRALKGSCVPAPGSPGFKSWKQWDKQRKSSMERNQRNYKLPTVMETTQKKPIVNNLFSAAADTNLRVLYHLTRSHLENGGIQKALETCHTMLTNSYAQAEWLLVRMKQQKVKYSACQTPNMMLLREKIAGFWCLYAHLFIQLTETDVFLKGKHNLDSDADAAESTSTTTRLQALNSMEESLWDQAIAILTLCTSCPFVGNHAAITLALSRLRLWQRQRGKLRSFTDGESTKGTSSYFASSVNSSKHWQNSLDLALSICRDGMTRSSPRSSHDPRPPPPKHTTFNETLELEEFLDIETTTKRVTNVLSSLLGNADNSSSDSQMTQDEGPNGCSFLSPSYFSRILNLPRSLEEALRKVRESESSQKLPLPYVFLDRASTRLLCVETNCLSRLKECLSHFDSSTVLQFKCSSSNVHTEDPEADEEICALWDDIIFFQSMNVAVVERGETLWYRNLETQLSHAAAFFRLSSSSLGGLKLDGVCGYAKFPRKPKYRDVFHVCHKCTSLFESKLECEEHCKNCTSEENNENYSKAGRDTLLQTWPNLSHVEKASRGLTEASDSRVEEQAKYFDVEWACQNVHLTLAEKSLDIRETKCWRKNDPRGGFLEKDTETGRAEEDVDIGTKMEISTTGVASTDEPKHDEKVEDVAEVTDLNDSLLPDGSSNVPGETIEGDEKVEDVSEVNGLNASLLPDGSSNVPGETIEREEKVEDLAEVKDSNDAPPPGDSSSNVPGETIEPKEPNAKIQPVGTKTTIGKSNQSETKHNLNGLFDEEAANLEEDDGSVDSVSVLLNHVSLKSIRSPSGSKTKSPLRDGDQQGGQKKLSEPGSGESQRSRPCVMMEYACKKCCCPGFSTEEERDTHEVNCKGQARAVDVHLEEHWPDLESKKRNGFNGEILLAEKPLAEQPTLIPRRKASVKNDNLGGATGAEEPTKPENGRKLPATTCTKQPSVAGPSDVAGPQETEAADEPKTDKAVRAFSATNKSCTKQPDAAGPRDIAGPQKAKAADKANAEKERRGQSKSTVKTRKSRTLKVSACNPLLDQSRRRRKAKPRKSRSLSTRSMG